MVVADSVEASLVVARLAAANPAVAYLVESYLAVSHLGMVKSRLGESAIPAALASNMDYANQNAALR
jgi:hypothetical protein